MEETQVVGVEKVIARYTQGSVKLTPVTGLRVLQILIQNYTVKYVIWFQHREGSVKSNRDYKK